MTTTTEQSTAVPASLQPLHDRINEAMETLHVPGVGLGLILDGVEHTAGFGVTNVDYPSPVLSGTLFQIGSTTKTITATAVMRLVEDGRIDLDAAVRTYVPRLRLLDEDVAQRVTTRQLLTHTPGWTGDYFADMGRGDDALEKIVEGMADIEQVTPLGDVWSYNNAAFYLAGRIVESVMDKPYEEAVRDLVLDPLGMNSSYFFPDEVMVHSFAVGHTVIDDRPVIATPWPIPRSANPAGGLTSTPGDQMRYARFHMGDGTSSDGTRVLSRATLEQMQTPIVSAGEGMRMGLSWFLRDVQGVRIVQHGGSTNGQQSLFEFAPERRFALTILTNADPGGELNNQIERWVLEHYLGISEPEPVHQQLSAEQLAEFVGAYDTAMTSITVEAADGVLTLNYAIVGDYPADTPPQLPPPIPAAFYAPDSVIAVDGPLASVKGEFLRDSEGHVAWLRFGGRLHRRQR